MLVGLLTTLLVIDGAFLSLLIVIQKSKGTMGLGALGGGAQTLFGGSGGQDIFQKTTWVLGGLFMAGSLGLSMLKSKGTSFSQYMSHVGSKQTSPVQKNNLPEPGAPAQKTQTPVAPAGEPQSKQ
jgi:preprotein translocase subunit SecG